MRRSLSLSRALSLPLSRAAAAAAPSADLSRRSLPRRSAAAAAPFLRPVHIFISAHSDVDVSDASAHCIRLPYSPRVLFVGVQVHFRCVSINDFTAKNENLIEKTFGNTGCVSAQLFHYLISVVSVVVNIVVVFNFVVAVVAAHKQV